MTLCFRGPATQWDDKDKVGGGLKSRWHRKPTGATGPSGVLWGTVALLQTISGGYPAVCGELVMLSVVVCQILACIGMLRPMACLNCPFTYM